MDKIEWIRLQKVDDFAILNTPVSVPNLVPQGTVPKSVNFTQIASTIPAADRLILQNQLKGTYDSLVVNINKFSVPDVQNDIENLFASGLISAAGITAIQTTLLDVLAGEPDPNWQPFVELTPAQQAGFDVITVNDWLEATA